ncbi:hypothetical protein LCGC14_2802070, partial [marine sediment metagenome]
MPVALLVLIDFVVGHVAVFDLRLGEDLRQSALSEYAEVPVDMGVRLEFISLDLY